MKHVFPFLVDVLNLLKRIFLISAIISLLATGSCNLFPDDTELPPVTQDGKDTFGCLVNGKLFLNKAPFGYGAGVFARLQWAPDTIGINIYASNTDTDNHLLIAFYDSPTLQVGKSYDLNDSEFFVSLIDYNGNLSCDYRNIRSGVISLSKFEISGTKKVVAGTFEFTATNVDCTTSVVVTQGRFDIGDVN